MLSKLNKMNKTICLHVLFGLFTCVIVSSYFDGFQKNLLQDSKGHLGENLSKFNPIHIDSPGVSFLILLIVMHNLSNLSTHT